MHQERTIYCDVPLRHYREGAEKRPLYMYSPDLGKDHKIQIYKICYFIIHTYYQFIVVAK